MKKVLKINEKDNVAVALEPLVTGDTVDVNGSLITLKEDIGQAHKFAITDIFKGEKIIKYASPIGYAVEDISVGSFVHTHNIKTTLSGVLEYSYKKEEVLSPKSDNTVTFKGFRRSNGEVGIRNEIWVINTVGCVNRTAENIVKRAGDGVHTFVHPFGCSQLGEDHENTRLILKNLVMHPNAGAVLVLGLGCENNNIKEFKKILGEYDTTRVRFLETQTVEDEEAEALNIIEELREVISNDTRDDIPLSELKIGLKCGGSDGFSGITANPLVGRVSNRVIDAGGSSILTEVPEMFGAETILMNRSYDVNVFDRSVKLINNFKEYFMRYNQVVYENPSPGNKDGGITTLEEKSLGCIQKGGEREVVAVLDYGERVTKSGLNLLNGPGNDIVAVTNLTAAGAHIILFTTGRGTPLGAPVPTIKVSTNTGLAERKSNWIDFNAGSLVDGTDIESLTDSFMDYIIAVASGKETLNEINNYREISIFKDGVTL